MKRLITMTLLVAAMGWTARGNAAEDVKEIVGTWDMEFAHRGETIKAMLSLAENSDGKLMGLWTRTDLDQRTNLTQVKFEKGKLTFARPGTVRGEAFTFKYEVTFEGTKVAGKATGPQGTLAIAGKKRARAQAARRGRGGSGGRGGARGGQGGRPQITEMIKAADANKDGKVTKEEAPEALLNFFDRLDANKDGAITMEEAEAAQRAFGGGRRGQGGQGGQGGQRGQGRGERPNN